MSASSAYAFHCFNVSRSAQGNASAAGSPAQASVEEFLSDEVGLCPAGVEFVIDGLHDAGFETDFLVNFRSVMAQGLEGKHPELLRNGQGVDHLSDEFLETADGLIGQAFGLGLCAP